MMNSVLCESARVRHPQEKCASKCVRGNVSLCLHLFFSTHQVWTCSSVDLERDPAKVEVARSNRAWSTIYMHPGMNAKWKAD